MDEEPIFAAAIEKTSPMERAAYLDRACGGDAELRSRVECLLRAHDHPDRFFDVPPVSVINGVELLSNTEQPGTIIGPYKLIELVGEGGMGLVYAASQEQPFRRQVALKIVKPGMDTRQVIARFEVERQALALMDHPSIAKVFDAGVTDSGRPFFVMELVHGLPITEHCDQQELTVRERLRLFAQVCHAVHHAHQKGIIHRDIKPGNVLVTMCDDKPVPKVIDFGVAKAIDQRLSEHTVHTQFIQMLGTPLYMSPEQVEKGLDVDVRSDIYSLGVLLYELLTGCTPFDRKRISDASFDDLRQILCDEEPVRPSRRAETLSAAAQSTIGQRRGVDVRQLSHPLRGELDWIIMKSLEKDRDRRYQSARGFAADVERFLRNEPVEAGPPSAFYRARKFARRHKISFVTVGVVLAALITGMVLSVWQAFEAEAARELAQQRFESERQARAEIVDQKARLQLQLYATDVSLARHLWEEGDTARCLELLKRHCPPMGQRDVRGFEWRYVWNCAHEGLRTWRAHDSPILTADASPDDRFVASGDKGGVVHLWDLATRQKIQTLRCTEKETCSVRFSPDGSMLATAGQDRVIRLWEVATWTEIARLTGHERTICSVAWSPDTRWLASACRDHSVRVWDVLGRSEICSLAGHTDVVRCVAWSPDGKLLASAGADMIVRLWDTATWQLAAELQGHHEGLLALAFSPSGRWLASAGYSTSLLVHDVRNQTVLARVPDPGNVWSLTFSPDSRLLAVGGSEGRLDVWQVNSTEKRLEQVRATRDLTDAFRAVAFVQRGEMLLVAAEKDQVLGFQRVAPLVGYASHFLPGTCLTVDVDRGLAATADATGVVKVRGLSGGEVQQQFAAHDSTVLDVALSPRGNVLASCGSDGRVCLAEVRTGKILHNLPVGAPQVHQLAFSPRGEQLAGGGADGVVRLWQVATGVLLHTLQVPKGGIVQAVFSPDGRVLAAGSYGQVVLWEVRTGDRLALLESTHPGTYGLAFSPDGALLAAGGDSHVSLWDIATRKEVAVMPGHRGGVTRVSFSADGQTLATLAADQTVRLWHIPTRREMFTLLHSDRKLNWLRFTSSCALLVGVAPDDQPASDVLMFHGIED